MPRGAFRRVFVVGRFAVKVPRLRVAPLGMRCNRWEREMWRTWRSVFGWANLCPVLFADPVGLVVVMPRAEPVTDDEVDAADPDHYPDSTAEGNAKDFGRVDGRVVAIDYGLPDAESVRERRAYCRKGRRRND